VISQWRSPAVSAFSLFAKPGRIHSPHIIIYEIPIVGKKVPIGEQSNGYFTAGY
jgi:hypothetical protein